MDVTLTSATSYSQRLSMTRSGQSISLPASCVLSSTVLLEDSKTPPIEDNKYTIWLGAGALRYGESDLHEPRSLVGLISNPDYLYSMWDDTSSVWMCESHLVIRHVPVAIKYWRDFYRNFKRQNVWDSIKQNWHSFRILMQEYQELGKDGFRSKWSTNGNLIPSHRIVATLRSSNRDRDKKMVTAATQDFSGQQFNKIFSYISKDGTRVLTSPSAIAKRYRKLGLNVQPWNSITLPDGPQAPPCSS